MGFLKTAFYVCIIGILYQQGKHFFGKKLPRKGGGFAAPGWRKVSDIFRRNLDQGTEQGGMLTVYHEGEMVVRFWGGYADVEAQVPWDEHTLSSYCSTAKAVGAIAIQVLIDRGLLDLNSLVADYWPEFGKKGKERITVAELLSHQAGLAIIDESFSFYDILNDPEKVGQVLAGQQPNWEIGHSYAGYHGLTMGLYMDQLVRRVDPKHRSLSVFFQEEIAEPFDIDFFIGLPRAENYRMTRISNFDLFSMDMFRASSYWNLLYAYLFNPRSLFSRSLLNPKPTDDMENNPFWQEVPSASQNGFGTGESMAKLMGIIANGGNHRGDILLTEDSIERLGHTVINTTDVILLRNIVYGPGTVIRKAPHGGTIFGHFGSGGQVAWADPKMKLGWSYLTNHHSIYALGDSPVTLEFEEAMYECISALKEPDDK